MSRTSFRLSSDFIFRDSKKQNGSFTWKIKNVEKNETGDSRLENRIPNFGENAQESQKKWHVRIFKKIFFLDFKNSNFFKKKCKKGSFENANVDFLRVVANQQRDSKYSR